MRPHRTSGFCRAPGTRQQHPYRTAYKTAEDPLHERIPRSFAFFAVYAIYPFADRFLKLPPTQKAWLSGHFTYRIQLMRRAIPVSRGFDHTAAPCSEQRKSGTVQQVRCLCVLYTVLQDTPISGAANTEAPRHGRSPNEYNEHDTHHGTGKIPHRVRRFSARTKVRTNALTPT